MDQSPEVIFNTIFLGGAILWTVLSSAVIYFQYSASTSESRAVQPKPRPSQIETEKRSAGIELKFRFGKEPQRKSKYLELGLLKMLLLPFCKDARDEAYVTSQQ